MSLVFQYVVPAKCVNIGAKSMIQVQEHMHMAMHSEELRVHHSIVVRGEKASLNV